MSGHTPGPWKFVKDANFIMAHWFYESQDNELIPVEVDGEADISWWYCEDCDETDSGSPEEVET